jgi:predicted RNase H-like nuclease
MRPVEKVAASLISWMGGGVQPANQGRLDMFGPQAPIWRFLEGLAATENPEDARTATQGIYLMEVFPALALAALDSKFFGRLKGPRYNLGRRKTFRIEDWHSVVAAVRSEAMRFKCEALAGWVDELNALANPRKLDQDRLDAAICLLVAVRWRLGSKNESALVGDLKNGYVVSPVSPDILDRLSKAASISGIPVTTFGPAAAE